MSDNPHYVTPEEAENKLCPIKNKDWNGKYCCIGKECMAWRWTDEGRKWVKTEDGEGYRKSTERTHGYCGMVPQ